MHDYSIMKLSKIGMSMKRNKRLKLRKLLDIRLVQLMQVLKRPSIFLTKRKINKDSNLLRIYINRVDP